MAGRPRKIVDISTGKISKQEKLNRRIQEDAIKIDRVQLESNAPFWLDETATQEFNRVVAEAKKINLWDNLDLVVLAIYADNYSRYIQALKAIRDYGLTAQSRGAFTVSPYVDVADKAATQILKCSTKLGLAVTDRLKLIVPTREEKTVNKFLGFVGNG